MKNVMYIPGLRTNLFSITQAIGEGAKIRNEGEVIIVDWGDKVLRFDFKMRTKNGYIMAAVLKPIGNEKRVEKDIAGIPVLDIIERVTGGLQMAANNKEIDLSVEIPRDMPHAVEADQALLYQAVYNLVENAIKYTPNGGQVTINLLSTSDTLTFAIKDSGIGIQPEDMKRLFEKFYRGTHREALAQRGTGLGLAIVKSIAERHRGKVWVESELGKGSTFFLCRRQNDVL